MPPGLGSAAEGVERGGAAAEAPVGGVAGVQGVPGVAGWAAGAGIVAGGGPGAPGGSACFVRPAPDQG